MAEADSVSGRLKEARFRAAATLRETVSQDRMAALISDALGRVLHATQWRRYESGEREPPLDVIRAAADVSGLSAAYIAFGRTESPALSPAEVLKQAMDAAAGASRGAQLEREDVPAPRPAKTQEKKGA